LALEGYAHQAFLFRITLNNPNASTTRSAGANIEGFVFGRATREKMELKNLFDLKFLIGFSLYVCGFLLWMYILSKFHLNIVFPIAMALFFVVSSLGSYFVLGESFSLKQIFGIALCFLGIVLVGLK
jgi:drug/metabolite transporter (DMT)-like permease